MWAGLGSRSPLLAVMSHIVVQEIVGEEGRGRRGGRAERSGALNTKRYAYLLGALRVFVSEGAAGKGGTGELEVELLWGSGVTAGGSVGAGVRRAVKASSTWPRASAAMEAAMAEQWMRTEEEARLRVPLREINVATLELAT